MTKTLKNQFINTIVQAIIADRKRLSEVYVTYNTTNDLFYYTYGYPYTSRKDIVIICAPMTSVLFEKTVTTRLSYAMPMEEMFREIDDQQMSAIWNDVLKQIDYNLKLKSLQ